MLTSRRAKVNGLAFVLGWLIGPGVVGAVVLSLAGSGGASKSGALHVRWRPPLTVAIVTHMVTHLLVLLGGGSVGQVIRWLQEPHPDFTRGG